MQVKKEHLLLFGSTLITLFVALGIIKWQAPQLLGLASDLQLVQLDEKVPPFYEGVFRGADLRSKKRLLKDPLTRVRARPLYSETLRFGPNDLLGFRNRYIPNTADIVVIGDSQTYGNNAFLEHNWPSRMREYLNNLQNETYSMASGGWGAVQYLDMFTNATVFRPKVVIVAFYSGNDSLESFQMVYGNEHWRHLIPDPDLKSDDLPKVVFPAPKSDQWTVTFADGVKTIFTPTLRLAANQQNPAVKAGYAIMKKVAGKITEMAVKLDIKPIFTIIPSKELVYSKKVQNDRLNSPDDFRSLVTQESNNIAGLRSAIEGMSGAAFVDVLRPLQQEALTSRRLYLEDINGHPVAGGYDVIGQVISDSVLKLGLSKPNGVYGVQAGQQQYSLVLMNSEGSWLFSDSGLVTKNGWDLDDLKELSARDFASVPFQGLITSVDPQRFGPRLSSSSSK